MSENEKELNEIRKKESNLNNISEDSINIKSHLDEEIEYRCPLCPKFAKITINEVKDEIISECPDNHYMKMDSLSFKLKSNSHPIERTKCTNCKSNKKAEIFCLECNKYFCNECIIIHNQKYLTLSNEIYSNLQLKHKISNNNNDDNNSINDLNRNNKVFHQNSTQINFPKNDFSNNIIKSQHHLLNINEQDNFCPIHSGEKFNSLCLKCNKSFCQKCLEEINQKSINNLHLLSCDKIGNLMHNIKKFNDILNKVKLENFEKKLKEEIEITDYIEENSNIIIKQILEKIEILRRKHLFKEQLYNLYLKNQDNSYLAKTIDELDKSFKLDIEQVNDNRKLLQNMEIINSKNIFPYIKKNEIEKKEAYKKYNSKIQIEEKKREKKLKKEERKKHRKEIKEIKKKEEKQKENDLKESKEKENKDISQLTLINSNNEKTDNILEDLKNNSLFQKIKQFFIELKMEKTLDNNLLAEINEIFQNNRMNINFYKKFLIILNESIINSNKDKDKKEKSSIFLIQSLSNLAIFTNIINNILEDIKDNLLSEQNIEYYLIFDEIISAGENIVFENTFMCALLNKNKIFKNINIWKNLIFNKIKYLQKDYSKSFVKNKSIIKKDNSLDINNNINEILGLNEQKEKFNKLSKKPIEKFYKYNKEILHKVIKDYLRHMGNYNFILHDLSDIKDIILKDLKIEDKNQIEFFSKYYIIYKNSSRKEKSKNIYNIKDKKIKKKILLIKQKKDDMIKEKYPCKFGNEKSLYIVIKNISKYLSDEDNIKLICLNKKYAHFNKIIYKKLLKNENVSIKKRINIWKSYLKCNEFSSKKIYTELLSKLKDQEKIKSNKKIEKKIINELENEKYKNRKNHDDIINILKILSFNKIINYYEELNSISIFLFELTRDEKEVFILINNLFSIAHFNDIFNNNQITKKFYVIDRLIYLYLPRIHCHFKDNNIKINKFILPYFTSLFSNVYIYLPENNLRFLSFVWDNFIFNGWNNIIEIILTIFKYLEKQILSLKLNELSSFLSKDLVSNNLFLDKNFNEFCELKKLFKLDKELINLLEEEISFENNNKTLGGKKIY